MAHTYSDPSRADDPHALPNVEVFYRTATACLIDGWEDATDGWYWWSCFPGCMPDSDPIGPFMTEAEALADAREDN